MAPFLPRRENNSAAHSIRLSELTGCSHSNWDRMSNEWQGESVSPSSSGGGSGRLMGGNGRLGKVVEDGEEKKRLLGTARQDGGPKVGGWCALIRLWLQWSLGVRFGANWDFSGSARSLPTSAPNSDGC